MKFWHFANIYERELKFHEYEPELPRKIIVYPAHNRLYGRKTHRRHTRGCPTGGLTRSLASDVYFRAPPTVSFRGSNHRQLTAPSTISHDVSMTLRTTLLSVGRSRVRALLERCSCPIVYTLVPVFLFFPD